MDAPTQREERGIHNPAIIDLITTDAATDEVVLVMLQRRDWVEGPPQIAELQEKFNSYFDYVTMGHLVNEYPKYAETRVRIQLEYRSEPPAHVVETLEEAERIGRRFRIAIGVAPMPDGRVAPWEK